MTKENYHYPIEATLELIGGKWKPLILFILAESGTKRFGEFRRILTGITQGMLTKQLREMESDGLIKRVVFPEIPPKVEYTLTPYGKTLYPILKEMCNWGSKHIDNQKRKNSHFGS
ncbi:winged helix-turn-helix transcriptional regulator [Heyndrickxia oleronia]|uniref:winged helix-turn-helix transcriptional regulator n=1 Tax=Heyndrickxia oleronia TaxID=38875 RepID=UPI00243223A4|nr:helix-turn-helix domain-containing protein [Heyndrickxia oleronia]MCI1590526.1 helix-turn-helix transcriptional regulator [Heyndrickxia oleronia]MCI1612564.1 helix-turn-helix transcriptional regulator [Heyndrickxia oleronia]MCI1743791.1 helix-turn-helix transcriptional regulator [Heyndrickxia oleronia]MCI1760501.1 helix-turn-helix transcriptional regulator [Heyndrickxia oleronia]